jgi:hypothetical protein
LLTELLGGCFSDAAWHDVQYLEWLNEWLSQSSEGFYHHQNFEYIRTCNWLYLMHAHRSSSTLKAELHKRKSSVVKTKLVRGSIRSLKRGHNAITAKRSIRYRYKLRFYFKVHRPQVETQFRVDFCLPCPDEKTIAKTCIFTLDSSHLST